jgi:LysM repeat protein
MAVAICVLVVLVAAAIAVLTQLDLGDDASSKGGERRARITTTTTAAPTTTTLALRKAMQYTVQQGDTLSAIARRFRVTTGAVVLLNRLTSPDRLTVGQTLTIPPEIPVKLVIRPATVAPGGTANLTLTGAAPAEKVSFEIQTPRGSFKGPVHVAGPDGRVTTTYSVEATDPAASYLVVVRGDQGTTATGAIVVGTAAGR